MIQIIPGNSEEWYKINGDQTLRITYDINKKSTVVDVGARHGNWADLIRKKYGCNVFCFEIVDEFCNQLKAKKYKVFKYAVWDREEVVDFGIVKDEASVLYDASYKVQSIPATNIFDLIGADYIDLIKINVEGAEYGILNNLIESGFISKIGNIQVQFHVLENSEELYNKLAESLKKTHELTWYFPFVWENWKLKTK